MRSKSLKYIFRNTGKYFILGKLPNSLARYTQPHLILLLLNRYYSVYKHVHECQISLIFQQMCLLILMR